MRKIVLIGSCLAIAGPVCLLVLRSAPTAAPPSARASASDTAANDLRGKLASAVTRSGAPSSVPTDVDDKLAALEARLHDLESQNEKAESERAEAAERDEAELTEKDVTGWLDTRLRESEPDRTWAEQARHQAEKTVAAVPGVALEGLDCSKHFCRAALATPPDAKFETLRELSAPPFASAITNLEPDGRMTIYFARSDTALTELRGEALASLGQ
jgi:hypothetical protein